MTLADKLRCDECDACGAAIELHLGYHAMQVAPSLDPDAVSRAVVRLCRKCEVGAQHAAARFVAYHRRCRGVDQLWKETT